MAYLIMRRGPEPGKIFQFEKDIISLGRGNKNEIIIHDNEVSREHLFFKRVPEGYELHDLKSSNGTFVNGQKVDRVWLLRTQCIIELGDSITFEFHLGYPDQHSSEDHPNNAESIPHLVITIESQPEPLIYPLENITTVIGRGTMCDIVVIEPEVSREHFKLTLNQRGYLVEDLNSTNGTIINDEPLKEPRLIGPNDVIRIGRTIIFQLTRTPQTFTGRATTNLLVNTKELTSDETDPRPPDKRRTTSDREIPALVMTTKSQNASELGTGLDTLSLNDQVLISYARSDWTRIIAPVVDKLYGAGIDAWVDQYLTEGSSDWLIATEQARAECWLLVIVLSPEAMRSDNLRKNWRHFQNREKPILLFVYEPVERMPIGVKNFKRIDYNPALPEMSFNQLVNDINRLANIHKSV